MDKIVIDKLEVFAHHGVFEKEKRLGQTFFVSLALYTDTRVAGLSDKLKDAINYGEVCSFVTELMQANTYDLIEKVAEEVANQLLLKYDTLKAIDVTIDKPDAPVGLPFGNVGVQIHRAWHKAYIALGSNMGDKQAYLDGAVEGLRSNAQCKVGRVSDYIVTAPYGGVEQDEFLNGVLELDTLLYPHELLDLLHELEAYADRKRTIHWGPRTLDLDILFYDDCIISDEDLIVPHIDMANRDFVLSPLNQIAPYLRHPVSGKTVSQMLSDLDTAGMK